MNDDRASRWAWRAIEAAALAAVLFSLHQTRQQVDAVEERVQRLDTRLAESAVTSARDASTAPLRLAGDAAAGDQEALAQRIVALLRAHGSAGPAAAAQRALAPESEETSLENAEVEGRVRQAQRIVAEALARGKLDREAVSKLRELQSRSGSDPRFAAMRSEVIAAINQQKLVPEDVAFITF